VSELGPNVAGSWYAGEPARLQADLERCLSVATAPPRRDAPRRARARARADVTALIVPHAGLAFSGATAGCAFREIGACPVERVVLLGPSHYEGFRGAAVPVATAYRTPLGSVDLDAEVIGALSRSPAVRVDDRPFRREHSLEMELPFLQHALPVGFTLVPILLGAGSDAASDDAVAAALEPWLAPGTLVVVSSDFTHFGARFGYVPFHDDLEQRIEELDMGAIATIRDRDASAFDAYVARTGATICGRHAIAVLLRAVPSALRAELVGYDTSGRICGDFDLSVSYASLVFERPGDP